MSKKRPGLDLETSLEWKRPKLSVIGDDTGGCQLALPISNGTRSDQFLTMDDCWREVCKSISYKSRSRCELACKSLSKFVDDFWKAETYFDFADVRPPLSFNTTAAWSSAVLAACSRIGASLRSLKMSVALSAPGATLNAIIRLCPNIERIDFFVSSDQIATVHFDEMKKLKQIRFLDSDDSPQSSREFFKRPSSGNLFVLRGRPLSPTLETLSGLHSLCLRDEDLATLRDFFAQHQSLTEFDMIKCDPLFYLFDGPATYPLFRTILDHCPRIRRLAIIDFGKASLDGIDCLANLTELTICTNTNSYYGGSGCPLTDQQIVGICAHNRRLQSLRIAGRDYRLGVVAYEAIATLTVLQELEITCNRHDPPTFSDASFRIIVDGVGSSLQRLSLHWPMHMSDKSIDFLGTRCPKLRMLVVRQSVTASFSAAALRRLINLIAVGFDPTMEKRFEMFLLWNTGFPYSYFDSTEFATEYPALVASTTLPTGVCVCRFYSSDRESLGRTIVPTELSEGEESSVGSTCTASSSSAPDMGY